MKNLNNLLERFSKILNRDSVSKETVSSVIENKIGIKIPTELIFIKEGVLQVEASPIVKNELRLKEEFILSELKETRGINISRILYK